MKAWSCWTLKQTLTHCWKRVFVRESKCQPILFSAVISVPWEYFIHLSSLSRDSWCILNTPRNIPFRSNNNKKSVRRLQASTFCQTWDEVKLFSHLDRVIWRSEECSVLMFFSVIAAHVYCCEVRHWKMLVSEKRTVCCIMGCLLSHRQPAELFIWLCNLAGWHSLGVPSL